MKHHLNLRLLALTGCALAPLALQAQSKAWTFDASLYGLAAGMSGNLTVKGVPADVDVGFDDVLNHLEFGAMGSLRVGHDRWALTTDVIYMGLGATKGPASADVDQWMVEPALSYRICPGFEALAGARYNNLSVELNRAGPVGNLHLNSGTQDWWDPIVGARLRLPFAGSFSFNVRGDIGGFGVGSDLTWQAFPYLSWQFAKWGSLEAGYRWLFNDYESGSGTSQFRYDILTQGPQFGLTFHF